MCLGRVVAWQRTTQQLGKRGEMGGACGQSRQSENVGKCLGGELLSLSLSLLALFGTLKFLNALFLGFCALFVILSLCKKATQRVARRKPQQKNPQRLKENLPFLDTSLALSMTANASLRAVFAKTAWQAINLALFLLFGLPRSLCSLAMTDKENALCHFAMTANFVILSVATQRVARRKPQQKNPQRLKENLPFLDTSLALSMTANASLRAVFAKTAWQAINLALFLLFGLPRSLCSLAMTDKENALCHFAMTANFVILSVATQRVARRKPQQKNPLAKTARICHFEPSLESYTAGCKA